MVHTKNVVLILGGVKISLGDSSTFMKTECGISSLTYINESNSYRAGTFNNK